jgi:hypothetical protein
MTNGAVTQPPWTKWIRRAGWFLGPLFVVWGALRVADGWYGSGVLLLICGVVTIWTSFLPNRFPKFDPQRPSNPAVLGVAIGLGAVGLLAALLLLDWIL